MPTGVQSGSDRVSDGACEYRSRRSSLGARGSPLTRTIPIWLTRYAREAGDPSLRLKSGYAQDDTLIGDQSCITARLQWLAKGKAGCSALSPRFARLRALGMTK